MTKEVSMVERVAKHICCVDGQCNCPEDCLARMDKWLAEKIIKEMREPTKAMICAVLIAHDRACSNPYGTRVIDDWQTMIDEALK